MRSAPQNIVGIQVPMHYAPGVQLGDSTGDLARDLQGRIFGHAQALGVDIPGAALQTGWPGQIDKICRNQRKQQPSRGQGMTG